MKVERRDEPAADETPMTVHYHCDELVVSANKAGIAIEGRLAITNEHDYTRILRIIQRAREQQDWLQGNTTPLPSDERFLG